MLATALGCRFEVERGPDWLFVRITSLDQHASEHPPLSETLWSLLQQHFTYRVVLELDGVGVLDSYLIGQLAALYERVGEHDGVMRLCGLSAYNRQVLHTCCLDDRFLAYHDRHDAVMADSHPEQPR